METSKAKKPQGGFSTKPERTDENVMHDMEKAGSRIAEDVQDKTLREKASTVIHDMQEHASSGIEAVDDAVSGAGRRMETWADGLRSNTPDRGIVGSASSRLADTLESSGRYLEEHGLTGMMQDVTDLVRRNPIPALIIGVGIGFILARATASRS